MHDATLEVESNMLASSKLKEQSEYQEQDKKGKNKLFRQLIHENQQIKWMK